MFFISFVGALRICRGTGRSPCERTAACAAPIAIVAELLFWRGGEISGALGKGQGGLRIADLVDRIKTGICQQQGIGIGVTYILTGQDQQPGGR